MKTLKTKFPLLYRVFVTNWKTSVCGILCVVAIGGKMLHLLDREDMQYLMGIAVTAGFFAAKDGVREDTKVAPEDVPS